MSNDLCCSCDKPIPKCYWCGSPATKLCDAIIMSGVSNGRRVAEPETCDAPMCDSCSTVRMTINVCPEGSDTVDDCPMHRGLKMKDTVQCESEDEVRVFRRQFRMKVSGLWL